MSYEVMDKKQTTCSRPGCDNERRPNQRYCRPCHAAYMREKRQPYKPREGELRERQLCRMKSNYYKRKGILTPEPCKCGSTDVQMHHHDYSKPLDVTWICRLCHAELHKNERDLLKLATA